eukprot:Em0002g1643a
MRIFICGDYEFLSKLYGLSELMVCLPGLHISQGIFLKIFNLLENACHDLDVKMALIHSGHSTLSPSYTNHVLNLQELNRAKAELDTVVQYLTMLVEHQTYLTVAIGQSNSILAHFEEHIDECRKEIKAAREAPALLQEAELVAGTFKQTFSLFAKCHFIYNQNYVSEAGCNDLEHAIATFMAHFRATFPGENIPIKMHMLEDHAVDWIRSNQHIGFGLMGEQGAESIHARFNPSIPNLLHGLLNQPSSGET